MFNVLNTYININKYKLYAPDKEREYGKKKFLHRILPKKKKKRHIIESNSGR